VGHRCSTWWEGAGYSVGSVIRVSATSAREDTFPRSEWSKVVVDYDEGEETHSFWELLDEEFATNPVSDASVEVRWLEVRCLRTSSACRATETGSSAFQIAQLRSQMP
jgi:hypothetical protein